MEDAMQLDLVTYITDDIGDDDMQSRTSQSPRARRVQNEHRPIGSGEAECVQNEHKPNGSGKAGRVQNEHIQAVLPVMSPHRLLLCLIVLGWSERELARRLRRHQTTITRWIAGSGRIDRKDAEWLEALVGFHVAHPSPRAGCGIGFRPEGPIPVP